MMFTVSYTKGQAVTLLYRQMQHCPTTVLQNIFTGSTRNNGSIHINIFKYHKELQISPESRKKTSVFRPFHKIAKSDYSFVMSVHPSAQNNLAPTRHLTFEYFLKICPENSSFIKI